MTFNTPKKDTLYYNGDCPTCSAEISRLADLADDQIELVDINASDQLPLDKPSLFSELHLLQSNGKMLTGLDANVAAWQHTKWAKLASILQWPMVNWFSNLGYRAWLLWYQRQRNKRVS